MTGRGEAERARRLLRAVPKAALGTILRAAGGRPYVSLVSVATAHDGAPLLLLSDLADHVKNLEADDRVSLLLDGTGEVEDPLAGERVSLVGRLARTDRASDRARYLARHPAAALYADFGDFAFYRMSVERAHLVGGFGRIHWLDGADLLVAPQPALAEAEGAILEHMNEEHREVVQLYAQRLLGLEGADWALTGIDPEGCDLRMGRLTARLELDAPIGDPETARAALVALARRARQRHVGES